MKKITCISLLCVLLTFLFFGSISCGGETGDTVAKDVYDALKAQLTAAQAEIADLKAKVSAAVAPATSVTEQALKDEIASLKAKVTELGNQITELNKQKDTVTQDKAAADAKYAELSTKYANLEKQLAATALPDTATEQQIENAVFALLNQERVKAGVGNFLLGEHLYDQARQNSRAMAQQNKEIFDTAVFYQEVLWAGGYTTVDSIARGALLKWKLDTYDFEKGALSPIHKYGAVGAFKSGGIVYITFYAASFP